MQTQRRRMKKRNIIAIFLLLFAIILVVNISNSSSKSILVYVDYNSKDTSCVLLSEWLISSFEYFMILISIVSLILAIFSAVFFLVRGHYTESIFYISFASFTIWLAYEAFFRGRRAPSLFGIEVECINQTFIIISIIYLMIIAIELYISSIIISAIKKYFLNKLR